MSFSDNKQKRELWLHFLGHKSAHLKLSPRGVGISFPSGYSSWNFTVCKQASWSDIEFGNDSRSSICSYASEISILEPSRADKARERSEFSIQTIFENIQNLYTSFDLGLIRTRENAVFLYQFLDM